MWESANLVAVAVVAVLLLMLLFWFLLLLLFVVLLLQLLLPLHVMLVVFVLLFFVIHNAEAASTDIDPYASGRSPQTSRICSGAYVATSYGRSPFPRGHHGALIQCPPPK